MRHLSATPDVAIIGAGVAGLSAALQLARSGVETVNVYEANDVASGSSGLSVGIVETQYLDPLDIELRVRSMEEFERLEAEGLRVVRNGYLRLCRTQEQVAAAERSVEAQRALGVRGVRVLDPAEIRRLVPDLAVDGVLAGLYGSRDGYVDGHELCSMYAEQARAAGATIYTNTQVEGVERAPEGIRLSADGGSRRYDVVVNAAGPWASRVGEMLGAPVHVMPQRHQAAFVTLPQPLPYVMPSVMDYTPHSGGYGLYFRDEGPGRLIAGLHTEEVVHEVADPDAFSRQVDEEFLLAVAEKLDEALPSLVGAGLSGGWAGLYPVTEDGYPLIGPHPEDDRVVVACGLGGFGIQVSPIVGRLVAEWVVHGEPRSLPGAAALLPERFARRADPAGDGRTAVRGRTAARRDR